jgi:predicted transcriptional regulator
MQKMIPALTERQRYWLEHIQACEASGKSMAEYATEHGVKVRAMYSGRKMLVNKGVLPSEQQNRFQRVQVMETSVNQQWRIGLPNGVSVAFAGEVDALTLTTVLGVSASLE